MKPPLRLCLLLCASTVAAAENWPQFRGPDGQGHADGTGIPLTWDRTNQVAWRTELPGQGWSSPVIWDAQIWMTTATEGGRSLRALCVDKTSGRLIRDVEVFTRETPMILHSKNSHASPTPVIEPGRVYVNFGTTGTACLDSETGKVLWRNTELKLDHMTGPGSSPVPYENLVVLTCDGTNVQYTAALNKADGTLAWRTPRSGAMNGRTDRHKSFCTPLVIRQDGADQLIIPAAQWLYGYEPRTGKELWRLPHPGYSVTPRPVTGHGLVFFATGYDLSELWAVRPGARGEAGESHIAWKCTKKMPFKPSPLLVGDELYVVSDTSTATCFDAPSGRTNWEQRLSGNFSASPILAGGRIYFCSEEGKTTVIAPGREFKQLAVNELGERIMASPAVSGGTLFLRTDKALYRIESK